MRGDVNDCFIFDLVRERFAKDDDVKNFDISKAYNIISSHPFNDGPLGKRLDHLKGSDKNSKMKDVVLK